MGTFDAVPHEASVKAVKAARRRDLRGFMGMGIKGEGPPNLAATKILGLFM
jgi:hypothetical protein